jgi:hypothetical protein
MLNILTQPNFDSGALAGMASIAHPITEPGHWRLETHGHGVATLTYDILVRDGGAPKVAITLGSSVRQADCCEGSELILAPNGMLNLNGGSARHGSYALLYRGSDTNPVWDTRALGPGDYFAFMPLRPGTYSVSNELGRAKGTLQVAYPDPRRIAEGRRAAAQPVHVRAGLALDPNGVEIDPGQLVVFAIEGPARLVAELSKADDGPSELAEWRRSQMEECLEAAFGLSLSAR